MSLLATHLIEECDHVYYSASIFAGKDNIDACTIKTVEVNGKTETIIAFRGTITVNPSSWEKTLIEAWLDWENDLHDSTVVNYLFPGTVHNGFNKSFNNLWPKIKAYTISGPLTITGHSKGGALAILAGWALRSLAPTVVTFAAPKVGDNGFASAYRMAGPSLTLYENPFDIVPHLPLVGYDKAGKVIGPPDSWKHPIGLHHNHCLATGYNWVYQVDPNNPANQQSLKAA